MPRKLRQQYKHSIYHAIIRGNNKQILFYEKSYFLKFLSILEISLKKYDYEIYSYCLMSNHVHLLLFTREIPISKIMHNICCRYAYWYNKMENHIGHVFQGRYKSFYVNDDRYCIELCRYIHRNPLKAGIVKHLDDYPWSSHRNYLGHSNKSIVNKDRILQILHERLGLNYKQFVTTVKKNENWLPAMQIAKNGKVTVNDTVYKMNSKYKPHKKNKYIPMQKVIETICQYFNISEKQINISRQYVIIEIRAVISYFLNAHSNMSITDIARHFDRAKSNISYQVQSIASYRLKNIQKKDIRKISNMLKKIKTSASK